MAWVYRWYVTTTDKLKRDSCWVDAPDRESAVQKACVKLGMHPPTWAPRLLAYQIGKVGQ